MVVNEERQSNFVIPIRLGKRKGFTNKAGHPLAQGVIPALNMSRLSGLFADHLMISPQAAKNGLIRLPKVTEGGAQGRYSFSSIFYPANEIRA